MNASRPEAEAEYSRGPDAILAVWLVSMLAAGLLLAAELTPLFEVRAGPHRLAITSVTAGAHDGYALLPVAALAVALGFAAWRSGSVAALAGVGAMGLVALGIALLCGPPGRARERACRQPRARAAHGLLSTRRGVLPGDAGRGPAADRGGRGPADRAASEASARGPKSCRKVRFLTMRTAQRFSNMARVTFSGREGCPAAAPGPVRRAALAFSCQSPGSQCFCGARFFPGETCLCPWAREGLGPEL